MQEAETQKRVMCDICPHACMIAPGHTGLCHARGNVDGKIACLNYGKITALALDPVEKKPFARWHPGSKILSVGSYGCNLTCPFCQNAEISQVGADGVPTHTLSPDQVVQQAIALQPRGNIGIAFTYNEPLVGFEFVYDTAKIAHEQGLLCALVTNGMVNARPFEALLPYIDAANIDLKGFSQRFYGNCGGSLDAVKRTIETAASCNTCHVEVTSLIVAGMSDPDEMEEAARWIARIDPEIPYHITQYHPAYRMAAPALPDREVRAYADRARAHLTHVYEGNM